MRSATRHALGKALRVPVLFTTFTFSQCGICGSMYGAGTSVSLDLQVTVITRLIYTVYVQEIKNKL